MSTATKKEVGAIRETFVDAEENCLLCEPLVTEDLFSGDPGELFRSCQAEYGRCISRMYVDTADGTKAVGWVFQRREKYDDADDTYIREVWVELLERPDTVTRTAHPFYL